MQTRDKTGDGDILIKNPQERLLKAHRSALRIPASAVENSGPKVHRDTPLMTRHRPIGRQESTSKLHAPAPPNTHWQGHTTVTNAAVPPSGGARPPDCRESCLADSVVRRA